MQNKLFPKESLAQEISRLGNDAFNINKPRNWISVHHGEYDCSIDFCINHKGIDTKQIESGFLFELKSKLKAKHVNNTVICEVELKNLNYYQNVPYPVMIVLCDLNDNMDDLSKAKLYYIWSYEIKVNYSANINSLAIPTANQFNKQLDLSAILNEMRLQYQRFFHNENYKKSVAPFNHSESLERDFYAFSTKHKKNLIADVALYNLH